ncbi:hypothetical protein PIB30_040814, partial [Stylosanthes scabra]|nr:hypothetical protein [Stylosanthes scabra]
ASTWLGIPFLAFKWSGQHTMARPRHVHRALASSDVNFVIKQRWRAAAGSLQIFIWTIIYHCEDLDVSFSMTLEPSPLDLCSLSYDQNGDKRSGLTALGEFMRIDLRMRIRHRIA